MPTHYRWRDQTLLLSLHVQPGAAASGFAGLYGDRLKLRIDAPATDDRANRAVAAFLADTFGVRRAAVELVNGRTSRRKTFAIASPARLPEGTQVEPA